MEENNNIFLDGRDTLVYLPGLIHKKIFHNICLGSSILYVRILGLIFQPPSPFKHMYAFSETATAVELFQKVILNTIVHYALNNMTQILQVNKNSNVKYNIIQVKLN